MSEAMSSLAERAAAKAAETPGAVAYLESDGTRITFRQIFDEARAVANGLSAIGLKQGDTISFQLPNWREAAAVNIAAAGLGLRINPVTPIYRDAELRMILQDCASKLIFIPHAFRSINFTQMLDSLRGDLPELRHVLTVRHAAEPEHSYEWLRRLGEDAVTEDRPAVDPGSPKLVLYTSGTTGRAKGAIHTHESVYRCAAASAAFWALGADDVVLMPSPATHVTGYAFGLELPFICGTPVLLMERWNPAEAVDLIERFQVTATFGATPFLKELLDEAEKSGRRLPSLHLFPCGGASVSPDLILRASHVTERCRAFRIYGATEVPMVTKGFIAESENDLAANTDGRVIDYDIKVADTQGRPLPRGEVGELRVRGSAMFAGYTDAGETAKALDEDGYFKTGDLGIFTEDDAIVVTGRLKDLIIRGGENLSPVEIEVALERHPAIAEAAVVAMPHPRLGEGVAAVLRAAQGTEQLTVADLARHLDGLGLARQKFPERVEYLSDFPRTASGKVRKDQLRALIRTSGRDEAG